MWDWYPPIKAGEGESAVAVEIVIADWHDPASGGVPPLLALGTWQCDCATNYIHWDTEHGGEAICEDCEESVDDGWSLCSLFELAHPALRAADFFSEAQASAFWAEYLRLGYGDMANAYMDQEHRRGLAAREVMARSPAWWRERG